MRKIALVSFPWGQNRYDQFEHLGISSLVAYLTHQGIRTKVIDCSIFKREFKDTIDDITRSHCGLAGFSVVRTNLEDSMRCACYLRKRDKKIHITFGGHEPTLNYERILKDCPEIDSIVIGEGEYTLAELSERVFSGRPWQDIKGIAYCNQDGRIIKNAGRPLIRELDSLPIPDRSIYKSALKKSRSASIYSSRGCFGNCSYCGINIFYRQGSGSRWRARSPVCVVDEIEMLVKEYGVNTVFFKDDDFIGPGRKGHNRARGIGEEILSRNINVNFSFLCRPDTIDVDLLNFLMKAGLFHVSVGIESWSSRQLELYNKKVTPADNDRALSILNDVGLDYTIYLILFDPYLTPEELLTQIEKIEEIGVERVSIQNIFNRLRLSPASPLHEIFRKDNLKSYDMIAGIPVQTAYEFVHPATAVSYEFGEKIYELYQKFFSNHLGNFNMPDTLYEKLYIQEVGVSLSRWIVRRYKAFISELIDQDQGSHQAVVNKYLRSIKSQMARIDRKLRSLAEKNGRPVIIKIENQALRFPFQSNPRLLDYWEFLGRVRNS
jgi:anaerobic magnesium-protoporphyrin IX monomethyl ester cyclase